MSTQSTEMYDDGTSDDSGSSDPNIRQLRERSKRTETAEAEAARLREENQRLQREGLFGRLGIDTAEGTVGELFAQNYKGELTEAAVKTAAARYNLLPQPALPAGGGDEPTAAEMAAAQRVQQAGQGGEHTVDSSDLEKQISELPPYGHPDWAKGRQKFHNIIREHGGVVERQRLTKQQTRLVNPMTGQPMKGTPDTAVATITPPS
jgi:hypothetical protein